MTWPRLISSLVVSSVAAVTIAGVAAQNDRGVPDPSEVTRRIEQPRDAAASGYASKRLDQLLAELTTPAVSIAIVKDYRIVFAKAWGMADVEAGQRATADTLFQAASISKPVAAMGVLRAVQDGAFGLDDDINTLLKSWKLIQKAQFLGKTKVTPRLLMSMTAGANVGGFPGYLPTDTIPTVPQILGYDGDGRRTPSNTKPVTIDWEPNTKYEYSGGGVTILQLAVSDVTGVPFADYLQRTVLGPIGMTSSCYCQPLPADRDARAARAYGWAVRQDGYIGRGGAKWHVYPELYAAGLWTTPSDLAKFMIEVQLALAGKSTTVLTQAMAKKMVTPGGIGAYALGFTVGSDSPHRPARAGEAARYFGHTGGNWGFRSNFEAHLDGGNGFVIMANSDDANPLIFQELPARIRAIYGWDR